MLSYSTRALAIAAALVLSPIAEAAERMPVSGFSIDATEVTIAEIRAFARATNTRTAAERESGGFEWGGGWQRRAGWTVYAPYGRAPDSDQEPAVHVSWHEASAFCRWRGGRLPTMAEWRLAAYTETRSAPTDGFVAGRVYAYPVGDMPEGMNTRETGGQPRHAPVRSTRRGVNGLYEMGGNVWEWIADRRGGEALTAGGSWWYGTQQTRADGAQWKPADFYAVYVGFRCVYDRS